MALVKTASELTCCLEIMPEASVKADMTDGAWQAGVVCFVGAPPPPSAAAASPKPAQNHPMPRHTLLATRCARAQNPPCTMHHVIVVFVPFDKTDRPTDRQTDSARLALAAPSQQHPDRRRRCARHPAHGNRLPLSGPGPSGPRRAPLRSTHLSQRLAALCGTTTAGPSLGMTWRMGKQAKHSTSAEPTHRPRPGALETSNLPDAKRNHLSHRRVASPENPPLGIPDFQIRTGFASDETPLPDRRRLRCSLPGDAAQERCAKRQKHGHGRRSTSSHALSGGLCSTTNYARLHPVRRKVLSHLVSPIILSCPEHEPPQRVTLGLQANSREPAAPRGLAIDTCMCSAARRSCL
ncbi:uncharacterized protein B0I36DRAFT_407852 [Microdochium trichocladiopsis]|uniref:Uncharacterized protein n=1 Tax=Microdochium trichocladiopsis TaxID=1682393 RepID=A0A9P9BVB8_9PEZI|nr:uncharacterized protein B0I36DRAFT_407852 [Microdochium trichocladiopsis]KAH7033192.1 hypothetical protein B0I36DRAFT_407852 [Microdochium trichocladiopsis]